MYKLKLYILTLTLLLIATYISNIYADSNYSAVIDVYGSKSISANDLKKEFSHEFQVVADTLLSPKNPTKIQNSDMFSKAVEKIMIGIEAKNKYAYFGFSPILYPNESHKVYITIDLVEKDQRSRLTVFLPQPTGNFHDPDGLIHSWNEYTTHQFEYFFKTKKVNFPKQCPVFHCLFGFEGKYKKYLYMFDSKVSKNKQILIDMLSKDKNEEHRATAALLLAHLKDGNELVNILVPSMRDPSSLVRNNVMRVLGATLEKLKNADFPVEEAIAALDFPNETDRNKALYILNSLSQQKRYASYIINHAGDLLLENLKMNQPNLHGNAYEILTKISERKFGERDYAAWQAWLNEQKR